MMLIILNSLIIAYMFYPIYKRLVLITKVRYVSACITCILFILIVTIPLAFVLNGLAQQGNEVYVYAKQYFAQPLSDYCPPDSFVCTAYNEIDTYLPHFKDSIKMTIIEFGKKIAGKAYSALVNIPGIIVSLFIMLFLMFFLLIDGEKLVKIIRNLFPLKEHHEQFILKKLNDTTYAVVYGQLITAIIQGIIGGIGFFIFGLPHPIFWGVMMALLALIPLVGPTLIWLPAAVYLIGTGVSLGDSWLITKGVLFFVYSLVFVSLMDNVIKPKIIGERANIHPAFVFLGVLGGLQLFGLIGVLIGPLILSILMTVIQIYEKEKPWEL